MVNCVVLSIFCTTLFGLISGRGIPTEESAPPLRIQQCREGCLEKFALENVDCLQRPECAAMDFSPPNLNNYIPEALRFLCWDQCRNPPPPKTLKLSPGAWPVEAYGLTRTGSLVSVHVMWEPTIETEQCLVTWEVSGGGLMGNLLTDVFNVELSLWPDTNYEIQVTCKNKKAMMTRSTPLKIDTSKAVVINSEPKTTTTTTTTTSKPSGHHKISISTENSLKNIINDTYINPEDIDPIMDINHRHTPIVIHSQLYSSTTRKNNKLKGWPFDEIRPEMVIYIFLCILVITILCVILLARRSSLLSTSDKQGLIENEILAETRTLHV